MLINHLRTALRGLARAKTHAFINIGGLAVGMAVSILIGLWIMDELSFDKYHKNYDRIVQVLQKEQFLGKTKVWDHLPYTLLPTLRSNFGQSFQHIVPAISSEGFNLTAGATTLRAKGWYADRAAPDMLTLRMLSGTKDGLADLHSILLSASTSRSLFGTTDAAGKTMTLDDQWDPGHRTPVRVTGVYDDLPANTTLHDIQYFLPWDLYTSTLPLFNQESWKDHRISIYAELRPGADLDKVAAALAPFELNLIKGLADEKAEVAAGPQLLLHPMKDWHLYPDFKAGEADRGPIQFVWMMVIIGAFVLLLACINFMNLSTARSERRAREVGIRKAIGSLRGQLIRQFFIESLTVVTLAFVPALLLAALTLPSFNQLAAKQLAMPWTNPVFWALAAGFVLFTGLVSGSYPALYLSSFNPVTTLKGKIRAGQWSALPRKALVVLQFTVSATLIISTIVVYRQLLFAKDRPVGYTRSGLLMVPMTSQEFIDKYDVLRNRLKQTGVVAEIAESESPLTDVSSHNGGFDWPGKPAGLQEDFGTLTVTYEYGQTIGWQFLAGRDFSRAYGHDSAAFVINESAAKYMGLRNPAGAAGGGSVAAAVGTDIHWKNDWLKVDTTFKIIGVIRDMVMQSPYDAVKPTIFRLGANPNWIYVRIDPRANTHEAIPKIAAVFKDLIPSTPFEYRFADEAYATKFATEERIGKVAGVFATLAVLISCLGLFGMALFIAEQRTREIGIRKVLGATVFTLWVLLSREFVTLVLLSIAIATPAAWYLMQGWLRNYPLHVGIAWWIYVATGIGAIAITLLTVSYQAIRTAMANPVNSLRSE
ncbi:MAG TPA: FtsX-like permease family protein [Puia sp.]|jgi:ABC-type antimicrobial peptide transport system permease subunit|nr:FtsX-like permease family protein [Puia sp.]